MKSRLVLAILSGALVLPAVAMAQDPVARNANEGARAGAAAGGPVGAIVGGTVGLATGLAEGITTGVLDAVRIAPPPPNVVVRERVVVGEPLPGSVRLYEVPNHTRYRYAVVNDQRVIVDPKTRTVIRVVD